MSRCSLLALFLLTPQQVHADAQPVDLSVALFPYLPDAESAAEKLEDAFEAYAKGQGKPIDLDLALVNTYGNGIGDIALYDVVEIDLCMLDALRDGATYRLDEIPETLGLSNRMWVGPADAAMQRVSAKYTLPHWVCGNFFAHWVADGQLGNAQTFEQILAVLQPNKGRCLYADLWGSTTLGEFYADAVLDIYGPQDARDHLEHLAVLPESDVRRNLRADAVLAIWRLTMEMPWRHRQERSALHDLAYVYPRAFAADFDSCLIGYSERLIFVERRIQEEPWLRRDLPVPFNQLVIRPFPFGAKSQGTPTWVDAFIIPHSKLGLKRDAITLFLRFVMSEDGYRCFLEPRDDFPAAYLLPAVDGIYQSQFVKEQMPALRHFRACIDDSFPVLDGKLYIGILAAGEQLEVLLGPGGS